MVYAVKFTRRKFRGRLPSLEESVWVMVETLYDPMDIAWEALWTQYPLWKCPYSQGNPPPNDFEKARHSWSSPFVGESRIINGL
jgi:hypothetical protein